MRSVNYRTSISVVNMRTSVLLVCHRRVIYCSQCHTFKYLSYLSNIILRILHNPSLHAHTCGSSIGKCLVKHLFRWSHLSVRVHLLSHIIVRHMLLWWQLLTHLQSLLNPFHHFNYLYVSLEMSSRYVLVFYAAVGAVYGNRWMSLCFLQS